MKKDYKNLNINKRLEKSNNCYDGFGAYLCSGDVWETKELYDELDEKFHDQVSYELFVDWIKDGILFLYDEEGLEVEIFLNLYSNNEVMITDIAYC